MKQEGIMDVSTISDIDLFQDFKNNPEDWIESCVHVCENCGEFLQIHLGGNDVICKNGCFR